MALLSRKEAPHRNSAVDEVDNHKYYNSSYTNVPRTDLIPYDANYSRERDKAINHNSKDGIKPMSKDEQEFERGLNKKLVKKFTMAIFSCDFTKFSFPVGYNESRTFIERSCDLYTFLVSQYINRVIEEKNKKKRLALLTTGVIASFHIYLQPKKPWNPVIGETYVGRWPNGVTIYGEQTSHHPPISNIQIRTPDDKWMIDAQFNFEMSQGIFQVDIFQKGTTRLELEDGTIYEWEFPAISVTGILTGDRIIKVKGPLELYDRTNNLSSHIKISPKSNKKVKELQHTRATTIYGGIVHGKYDEKKKMDIIIHGDYAEKVYVNDEVYWDIEKDFAEKPYGNVDDDELIPSDCRYRLDRSLFINNEMSTADKGKHVVEELQRYENKIRHTGDKEQKKDLKNHEKGKKKKDKSKFKDEKNVNELEIHA